MARYRKKHAEVHAYQWMGNDVPGVCRCNMLGFDPHVHGPRGAILLVKPGDWVVHEGLGLRSVMDDESFHQEYVALVPKFVRRLLETTMPGGKSILAKVDPEVDHGHPKWGSNHEI